MHCTSDVGHTVDVDSFTWRRLFFYWIILKLITLFFRLLKAMKSSCVTQPKAMGHRPWVMDYVKKVNMNLCSDFTIFIYFRMIHDSTVLGAFCLSKPKLLLTTSINANRLRVKRNMYPDQLLDDSLLCVNLCIFPKSCQFRCTQIRHSLPKPFFFFFFLFLPVPFIFTCTNYTISITKLQSFEQKWSA